MMPHNPLQIPTALVFAVLLAVISVVTVWVRASFGTGGLMTLSAVVGLADVDPFVLNIAEGGIANSSDAVLCASVLVAASSNNVAKAVYAAVFGGAGARRPAALLLLLALLGVAAAAIYVVGL